MLDAGHHVTVKRMVDSGTASIAKVLFTSGRPSLIVISDPDESFGELNINILTIIYLHCSV